MSEPALFHLQECQLTTRYICLKRCVDSHSRGSSQPTTQRRVGAPAPPTSYAVCLERRCADAPSRAAIGGGHPQRGVVSARVLPHRVRQWVCVQLLPHAPDQLRPIVRRHSPARSRAHRPIGPGRVAICSAGPTVHARRLLAGPRVTQRGSMRTAGSVAVRARPLATRFAATVHAATASPTVTHVGRALASQTAELTARGTRSTSDAHAR